jgi:glucose/mannose-6-phosphate isomerase
MKNFSDLDAIKKLDPRDTLGSTELMAKQCQVAWEEVGKIEVPQNYKEIDNIVCCGMGASIYGALVTRALIGPEMKYPFELVSDYHLPKYVNDRSLVILTSYSGTTEEVLSCAGEAKEKNTKMLALTKGGELAEFARENNLPAYIFDGKLNPAGVPRLGNGYSVLGLLGLLFKAGIINVDEAKLKEALEKILNEKDTVKTNAMDSASLFEEKIPVIIAAEHLAGNAQILRNQFNETSKAFSAFYLVPDLNHHLMEGLQFPIENNLYFILLDSDNYSDKIKKRMLLTKEVIVQNKRNVFSYNPKENNIYADFLNTMLFGSFLTLYLGLIYDQNPAVNPWVDYFKDQLKK